MNFLNLSSFLLLAITIFQTAVVGGNRIPNPGSGSTAEFTPIKALICPPNSAISPCSCVIALYTSYLAYLKCEVADVNQTTLENAFGEIRRVNQIPPDGGIDMYGLHLENSHLEELDMALFYGNRMDVLDIRVNWGLRKLVTSGNPGDHGSIHVKRFYLLSAPLTRQGLGDVLKYFANEMDHFDATGLDIFEEDADADILPGVELLPGLSALTALDDVYFFDCEITGRLEADTWIPKELTNLLQISFSFNHINYIGENAFSFYEGVGAEGLLEIYFYYNQLNESSFHPNSGIIRPSRITELSLQDNQITTLPTHFFQAFLDAHPQNKLGLNGNPLVCDGRLSWIKARREELEDRVVNAMCQNDPGYDIFNSKLIP